MVKIMNEPNRKNGYKDPDQSVIDFALIEMGADFDQVADPARGALWLARDYRKTYTAARNSSIAAAALGGLTVAGALAISLPVSSPLVLCGLAATGLGGLFIRHHASGAANSEAECRFLEQYPELPKALAHAVGQGLSRELAVAVYQRWLSIASTGRTLTSGDIQRTFAEATNAAIEGYKLGQQSATAFSTGELVNLPDYSTTAVEDEPDDDDEPVEQPATKLNVPAFLRETAQSPKTDGVAVQPAVKTSPTATATPERNAVDDLVKPVRSSYIAAPPRTGKGVLVALGLRRYKELYPNGILFTYTPKQDPKENWYWVPSDCHYNPDFGDNLVRPGQQLYRMIRQWQALDGKPDAPVLFVFDELSVTLSKFKSVKMCDVDPTLFDGDSRSMTEWLLDFIIHEASMRQSVDRFIWCLTPLATVGEAKVSKSSIMALKNYTLASRENRKFADGGSAAFAAPAISEDHPLLQRHYTIAWCHDSMRWLGVPVVRQGDLDKLANSDPKLNHWQESFDESPMDYVMDAIAAQTMSQFGDVEPVDELTKQMRAVYAYIKKRGVPVDKRGVQQAKLPALDGLNAADIGSLLELMLEDNFLQIQNGFYTVSPNKKP
jgi:hypothetical protein